MSNESNVANVAVASLNDNSSVKRATKQAAPKELWGRKLTRSERQCWAQGFNAARTPAAPGIDLEQFREAVQGWRDSASNEQADGLIIMAEWLVIADRADRLLALIDASPKYVMCGGCGNSDPDKRCLGCRHDFGASPKGGAQPVAGSAVRALPARWLNEKTGLSAIGCANELTNALANDDAVASPNCE